MRLLPRSFLWRMTYGIRPARKQFSKLFRDLETIFRIWGISRQVGVDPGVRPVPVYARTPSIPVPAASEWSH